MPILNEAARARAPISSLVAVLTITSTATRYAIPAAFAGKFATFTIDGIDADVVFGNSTVSCTYAQGSAVASEVITVNAASGGHLTDGVPRWWLIPTADEATHFAVDGSAAGPGYLYIELATP